MARRPLTLLDGISIGIGALAMLPVLYFAVRTGVWEDMYKQMGPGARMPALTKLMFSMAWRVGAPVVLIGGWGVALGVRPSRYLTLGLALATVAVAVLWGVGLYSPIFALAGSIQ